MKKPDEPGWRAEGKRQATGGARSEGEARDARRSGGPRSSTKRATIWEGSAPTKRGALGSTAGCGKLGAAVAVDPCGAGSEAWTVRTQLHSEGHTAPACGSVGELDFSQLLSFVSVGETQQQNQSEVPQVRPSHSQEAYACGAAKENSSATKANIQMGRKRLTRLL